jgi:hypothetical protein
MSYLHILIDAIGISFDVPNRPAAAFGAPAFSNSTQRLRSATIRFLQTVTARPAMRNAVIAAAALAALWMPQAEPAQAREVWPVIPAEQGTYPVNRVGGIPWRCSDEPVYNFYHGAYYLEPPAVWLGYAYRPHYRYTAWRVVPRTYACAGW